MEDYKRAYVENIGDYVEDFIAACHGKHVHDVYYQDYIALNKHVFLNAHPDVTHAATDDDGEVYGFIGKPVKNMHSKCWIDRDGKDNAQYLGYMKDMMPGSWELSLMKRI